MMLFDILLESDFDVLLSIKMVLEALLLGTKLTRVPRAVKRYTIDSR